MCILCDTEKLKAVLHTQVPVACTQIENLGRNTNSELNTNKFQ
jgi:hypothetical protein